MAATRTHGAVSVVVPTRNESGNVSLLVSRLAAALEGLDAQVIFVDDSDDGTPHEITAAARESSVPVRLHHRQGPERTGGLGGAVVAGLRLVESPWAVVMDGDLQHPPELVPRLVEVAELDAVDVVVASRHVDGGAADGLANGARVMVSDLSTRLAKLFFPGRLRGVSDPMSGFFLLRPAAFDLDTLRPNGFKILMELLVRTRGVRKREVPFVFGERHAGESKASLREGLRFLQQVARLAAGRLRPPGVVARGISFGAVGLTGLVVNTMLMWLLADPSALGWNYLVAAALATQGSSTWNFALVDTVVYRGPKRLTRLRRWAGFLGMSNAFLLLRIPMLAALVTVLGVHYLLANTITLMFGFALRFSGQERLTLAKDAS
jgi:dolichol-phosphate mannosyltransferase